MTYRPVCDVWILCRAKLKDGQSYHGAFPAGFLHRARQLLGVRHTDPVLHVCGGMVRECLYRGFGPNDRTLDLDPEMKPDYIMDARRLGVKPGDIFPFHRDGGIWPTRAIELVAGGPTVKESYDLWPAILIDRPYTSADHAEYDVPADVFPSDINDMLKRALTCVEPGGRVGVLDYIWPSPPTKLGKEVAVIAVGTGRNNRARWFTVFERLCQDSEADASTEQSEGEESQTTSGGSFKEPDLPDALPTTPSRRRRKTNSAPPAPSLAAPARQAGRRAASGPNLDGPGEGGLALQERGEPIPEVFACEQCHIADPKKGTTILSERDGKRRCGPCHRLDALKMPAPVCVACGDTGKNSKGGSCVPCVQRAELASVAEVADVCAGCREGFQMKESGMARYTPITDHPNVWHRACWDQAKRKAEEAAVKAREERDRAEAREKGWPICGGCNRAVTPDQKQINGRHPACGQAKPRRRGRSDTNSMDGGFDV